MTHWQHMKLTRESILEAQRVSDGLGRRDIGLLRWIREQKRPVLMSMVGRDFLRLDVREFFQARHLLEALALNGYLLRGRYHSKTGQSFSGTHYRCSLKARKFLGKIDDTVRSTTTSP